MSQMGMTQANIITTGGRAVQRYAPGIWRTVTGRISSITLASGQKFSARRAAQLIKRVGFQAAAAALGVGIAELAELLLQDAQTASRRRRKGITYAQLRNAKRVSCTISRMARDLGVKPAPARRGSCR